MTGKFTFEHFIGTPLGAGSLAFADMWFAYSLIRKWKQKSKLGKLTAVFFSVSTLFGVFALIGIWTGVSESVTSGESALAGLLAVFGIGAWSYSKPGGENID